jgi:RNA polymerase sigma factor (sigma-70 family)
MGISSDDLASATDFALVCAARRYDAACGASFQTYARHFVRGEILKACKGYVQLTAHEVSSSALRSVENEDSVDFVEATPAGEEGSPYSIASRNEARVRLCGALAQLSSTEKEIFLRVHLGGEKLAHVARSMSYSRGHASELRRVARCKLQEELSDWNDREAA